MTRTVEFVPVVFDDIVEKATGISEVVVENPRYDGHVYDLIGRRVASAQQVADGTWRQQLPTGVYLINGKKMYLKR